MSRILLPEKAFNPNECCVHVITGELKQFDYAVANPPFSYKAWTNGWDPANDLYKRFEGYDAQPPNKNGDFAFLLHLITSLKSTTFPATLTARKPRICKTSRPMCPAIFPPATLMN